jgi:flagellar motility protein MotE (MotC chaperone)
MADEKKDEKEKKAEVAAKPASGMKSVILVCLGVFLVATAAFAWMEGLFAPAPVAPDQQVMADSLLDSTQASSTPAEHAPSPENETLAQAASRPNPNTLQQQSASASAADLSQPVAQTGSREEEMSLAGEKRQLAMQRQELEKKQKELEGLKSEIEQLLARVQESKSERITMMAKLYDSMDPEAVARQISSMDDRTVILLLPQMNTRTAAKVMAAIDPKRAAQITTKMLALEQ